MATELTKRQLDILRVPPMIWSSIFGSYLFRVQVISENIDTDPATAKTKLAELEVELRNIQTFLVNGDT